MSRNTMHLTNRLMIKALNVALLTGITLFPVLTRAQTVGPEALSTVQFTSTGYTCQEGSGSVGIRVVRTGDTSTAVAVDYVTRNITASAFSDYTTARGTLRFAAGETNKTITVLITDDSLVEGSEVLALTLSNPAGATLGYPNNAALAIVDNDSSSASGNRIDEELFFVIEHYFDFLNRVPDAAGLDFWTRQISDCGANAQCREVRLINVSASFFLSIEFYETGYLVYRLHKAAFNAGERLQLAAFLSDSQEIGRGVIVNVTGWEQQLESNKQTFVNQFVTRPEFITQYPQTMTPAQFVDGLNSNTGGSLTTAQRNALVTDLTSGAKTRAQTLRAVAENSEFQRRAVNEAFVLMQYFGYLRRNPNDSPDGDFSGYSFWLQKLNQFGGSYINAEMVKAFTSSIEYRTRFGCNVALSSTRQTFDAAGGNNSVGVVPSSPCAWKAVSNDSWLTVTSGPSGNSTGTISYRAAANTASTARVGTISVNGLVFTVTQAGAASSLGLSRTAISPGETQQITGSGFDPQADTSVVFTGANGYRVQVPAWSVTANTIKVVAPVFLNMSQGVFSAGAVKATVLQSTSSQVKTFGPSTDFQILDLPAITWTPGVVTLEVFKQMQQHAAAAIKEWQAIQTASGGKVNVQPVIDNLTQIQKNFADREAAVRKITSGAATQVLLGKYNGRDAILDRNSVILMDRLYYASLLNNAKAQTSSAKESNFGPEAVGDLISPLATDDDIARSVATAIGQVISDTRDAALANASRLRGLAIAGVAVAFALGAIPATPAIVLGAVIISSTTWPTIANTLLMRSVSRQMQNQTITPADYADELNFAVNVTYPPPDDAHLTDPTPDGQTVNNSANVNANLGINIAPTLPGSVGTQVAGSMTPILANLPRPTPAAITVEDNGSEADDAFEVMLDGVVIGRTAIGASNTLTVAALTSGPHSLQVTCTIAPDNVGTYGVSLSQGVKFSDGTSSKSGDMAQGASVSFTIIAP